MDSYSQSVDEKSPDGLIEEITVRLAAFDPTASVKYTPVNRRVLSRFKLFGRGKLVDTYPVAWQNNVNESYFTHAAPLDVRLRAELTPVVWVTSDRKLLEHWNDLWIVTSIEKVPAHQYRALLLGLRGDFETIYREYKAACVETAYRAVDSAVEKENARIAQLPPLQRLKATPLDTTAPGFSATRDRFAKELLANQYS